MTDNVFEDTLAAAIIALRNTLAKAMVDATTACKDLEDGNPRAAVGAVIPIEDALHDASALLRAIRIFNRNIT